MDAYEKKYKEALEKARQLCAYPTTKPFISDLQDLFPELAESENERMIQYFKDLAPFDKADELYEKYGFSHKDAIAWLEKQGKNIYNKELSELLHKVICRFINDPDIPYSDREKVSIKVLPYVELLEKQGDHANFLSKIQIGDKVTRNEDGVLVNLSQLNRIAKPDEEKGEQKLNPALDIEIPFGAKDSELQEASYHIPEGFHVEIEGNRVVIRRGEQKPVGFNIGDEITVNGQVCRVVAVDNLDWSEEDEKMLGKCIDAASGYYLPEDKQSMKEWLKSLKERVQPQPKQEWSEEDETALGDALWAIKQARTIAKDENDMGNLWYAEDWLKSLKVRHTWKPSEEQIKQLGWIAGKNKDNMIGKELMSLYEQLKELKG